MTSKMCLFLSEMLKFYAADIVQTYSYLMYSMKLVTCGKTLSCSHLSIEIISAVLPSSVAIINSNGTVAGGRV